MSLIGARMTAPMIVQAVAIAFWIIWLTDVKIPAMAFHAVCTPVEMPFHRPAKKPVTPFQADCTPDTMPFHRLVKNDVTELHADCTDCTASWNTWTMPSHSPMKNVLTACHACCSHEMNDDHICRPSSVLVKKSTSAVTSAVMAMTTRAIGLADMTALNAPCTAVAAVAMAFHAACAALTMLRFDATCFSVAATPPISLMNSMVLEIPLAAPPTACAAFAIPLSPLVMAW